MKIDRFGKIKIDEIIGGLKFTVDMVMLDPMTGIRFTKPRNDFDKITVDACNGAIELLEMLKNEKN